MWRKVVRESLKTLELDACLTVPCLFGTPERDVIVGIHVVDFFCAEEKQETSYGSQTNYKMIVGHISREISWAERISFRSEMTYHQKMIGRVALGTVHLAQYRCAR